VDDVEKGGDARVALAGVTTYHSVFAEPNPISPSNPPPERSHLYTIVILSEAKDPRATPTTPEGKCLFNLGCAGHCDNSQRVSKTIKVQPSHRRDILLLVEIHGRIGHFPTLIRIRPKHGSITTYEVIELLNLQTLRDAARKSSEASITSSTTSA
jgi:hypothetical protein